MALAKSKNIKKWWGACAEIYANTPCIKVSGRIRGEVKESKAGSHCCKYAGKHQSQLPK